MEIDTPLICTTPVPLLMRFRLMLVSVPVAATETVAGLAVAALVTVIPSTAEATAVWAIQGFPFVSSSAVVVLALMIAPRRVSAPVLSTLNLLTVKEKRLQLR